MIATVTSRQMIAQATITKGVALVIGNTNYKVGSLPNGSNDAKDMSDALKSLGFDVLLEQDVNLENLRSAIKSFGATAQASGKVAIFYFSGHGIQVNGQNYLIPVDAKSMKEMDVNNKTVSLQTVFDALGSRTAPNIIILDACRVNPFLSGASEGWVKGLIAPANPPSNSVIAFSTSPGSVAADGEGTHSPYTRALLKYMRRPGQNTDELFTKVRADVEDNTDNIQVPWENTSLGSRTMLRDPVFIEAQFSSADDDALLMINGQSVLDWNENGAVKKRIQLQGGINDVVVKVYNQRSYTGGIPGLGGHLPEGWNYGLIMTKIDGTPLFPALSGGEDHPADNGAHHGKLFTVASMKIFVDEFADNISVLSINAAAWKQ
ncbi:caspase family protein [Tunturiibacter lichenicola]|uniref:caspase family protein n=1 Tax=Tunturiibacter lichenicola TaxID=2051959 RepID=UPI003D9BD311